MLAKPTTPEFPVNPSLMPTERIMWALSYPGINHAASKVLAALAHHAHNQKLTCFPSVATLSRETRVSERGTRYALRELEAAGAILTERSRGRSSSLYRLMIGAVPTRQDAPHNPADSAPTNPARTAPQQGNSLEQSKKSKKQPRAREVKSCESGTGREPESSTTGTGGEARHTCTCGNSWPTRYGTQCFKCRREWKPAPPPDVDSGRLARILKPMRPDDGPEADALAPRRPPEPIATPAPVAEPAMVELWCPDEQCQVTTWIGAVDSRCSGCQHPGVEADESGVEQRRRIVAELVGGLG